MSKQGDVRLYVSNIPFDLTQVNVNRIHTIIKCLLVTLLTFPEKESLCLLVKAGGKICIKLANLSSESE